MNVQPGEVQIASQDGPMQRVMRVAGKNASTAWVALDNVGNVYSIPGYETTGTGGRDEGEEEPIIVSDGYQTNGSGGRDEGEEEPIIVSDGYQDVLDYLRAVYGVIIEHNEELGVDLLTLPRAEDPLDTLFRILISDTLNGRPLIDYFRLLEVVTAGVFDEPAPEPVKPGPFTLEFPNDSYYSKQWNLLRARIGSAQWHPAVPKKQVRVAVIDSGIGKEGQLHEGLDGAAIEHQFVAPTTGYPVSHALGVVSLLADGAQDASGIVGLMSTWNDTGCFERAPFWAHQPPQILSFNVGDFTPRSLYVAQAIHESIEQGVDVINLSLRLAYSPVVEEAIQKAQKQNIIVVAAAGNYPADAAAKPTTFPANMAGVIAVGAAGPDMQISAISANDGVDILAPGDDVLVGGPENVWYYNGGTSLAAPHVTATVAMMRAVQPELTSEQALKALLRRAQYGTTNSIGFLNTLSSLNDVLPESERVRYINSPHFCSGDGMLASDMAGKASSSYDDSIDDDLFQPAAAEQPELPETPTLAGNYPNPFNPSTSVRFLLPAQQDVRLAVYNTLGQEVAVLVQGTLEAGEHTARFDASALPSGVYFARLETEVGMFTQSMVLVE